MNESRALPFSGKTSSRRELIAMAQLLALHIDHRLFEEDTPLIILLNGSANSGKSLIPTAFAAQLGEIRTSRQDIIGRTTWYSEHGDVNLRLHFIDAAEVYINPLNMLRDKNRRQKDTDLLQQELKGKGDVVFLQNVPEAFRAFADMEIVVTNNAADWHRLNSIMIHSDRLRTSKLPEFLAHLTPDKIKEVAKKLPEDYLMPNGEKYGPVLE